MLLGVNNRFTSVVARTGLIQLHVQLVFLGT
jgi:hypothetical protein